MSEIPVLSADANFARRTFLAMTAASAAGLAVHGPVLAQPAQSKLPVTGTPNRSLEPFDKLMTSFLQENKVPGASLAITSNRRLVYARGFGYADVEKKESVQPAALFRIASVSKPITAVAVMQLVAKDKLKLDDKVMDRMMLMPFLAEGAQPDPRWNQITVRQCLQHTGGWDRSKSYDPIVRPQEIARTLGIQLPVEPEHVVRYMMGQPLDFNPGERHAYSNLGYLVLGRIIEAVTGQQYEAYVQQEVLGPLGVTAARLGLAQLANRTKDEVRYYDSKLRTGPCLFAPQIGQQVPLPYGAENFEAYEAHGGWIASAVELVKFASALDDPARCPILAAKAIEEMWSRPDGNAGAEPDGRPKAAFYGCGWNVRPIGTTGKSNTWHTGNIAGTESLLVRRWDGLNWAVLFNTCFNPEGKLLAGLIDGRLHEAAGMVKVWPRSDQFGRFLS
ncbi:MAG: serine hydrolase domain-containing protein [Planctomycetota bacterium]